jgi:hypothetical protein
MEFKNLLHLITEQHVETKFINLKYIQNEKSTKTLNSISTII